MAIGQKMGSLKALKQSMAKGSSSGAWIKYIPKNGSMNVRFIQEPEEWVNYVEHFDATIRKSYPCNGETSCPGCTTGERKTNRYLANVLDVDSQRVVPLQMPKDLANRLVVRYEKAGTLIDRDYELSRSGEGLDTVYDLDAQPKDNKKITQYQPLDLIQVLDDAYANVFGGGAEEDEDAPAPTVTRTRAKSKAAKSWQDTEFGLPQEDNDESVEAEESGLDEFAKKADPVFQVDEDDDDPDDEEDDSDGEYTEESLKALPLGALRAVAREFGVDVKGKKADDIIAEIMAAGEPVEDD